jgi:hypothetical protein
MQRILLAIINVGFDVTRSNTEHIFCISQILQKKWKYNKAVHVLFTVLKKAINVKSYNFACYFVWL